MTVLLLSLSVAVQAQSRSSRVYGVVSGSGHPLPAVHLRLSRNVAPQQLQEMVTDANGRFRFVGLTWGSYTVEVAADGWQSRQVRIDIRPDNTVALNITLAAEGREAYPPRPQLMDEDVWYGTNFTDFALQQLPNGRNIWSLLQNQEPSTVTNRFEVGGTQITVPALFSAFGASWTENQYRLNGLDVTDPYTTGLPLINPDFDTLTQFQVITASKPAPEQASGESLLLASPSPNGELHGGAAIFGSGGVLQSDNMNARLQDLGFPGPLRLNTLLDGNVQLGGKLPIRSTTLPFFVSISTQQVSQNLGGFAAPIASGVNRVLLDFTPWSDRTRRLDILYSGQHVFNSAQAAAPTVTPESTTRGNDNFNQFQALWSRSLTPATLLSASFGVVNAILSSSFQSAAQGISTVDLPRLTFAGPAPLASSGLRTRYEATSTLQSLLNGPLGSHSISVGFDWSRSDITQRWYALGNTEQVLVNGQANEVVMWNTPAQSQQYVQNVAESVQDSWRPWRWLALPIGLRIDSSTGRANGTGNRVSWTTVQPHLGFVTPFFLPGLMLRGSWSRYGQLLQGQYLNFGNPSALGAQLFRWQDANSDGIVQPEEVGQLLRVWGGPYSAVDPNISRPYTDEFSFGLQENIANRLTASIRFFRRDDHRLIALENTGVPFSQYTAVRYLDPGNDGTYGNADDRVLTLYNENPSALGRDFLRLTNLQPRASYRGFEALVVVRPRSSLEFSASFTAGQTLATTSPGNSPLQNDTGVVGSLAIDPNTLLMTPSRTYFDRGYIGKITAYYAAPRGFSLSAVGNYFDGSPFGRLLFVNGFNQGPFFARATPIGHPGGFQTQLNATIDLRLAREFRMPRGTLSGYLDVFNLLNWNSNTQESALTGPAFLLRVPLQVEAPRTIRLDLMWHF